MDSSDGWNAEGIFQKYLHDYLVKNNMHRTAELFVKETNADVCPVAIDSPQGFLAEWWSIFHDVYFHMQLEQVEETGMVSNEGKHVSGTSQNPFFGSSKFGINSQNSMQFSFGNDSDSMLTQLYPKTCEGVHHKCVARKVDAYSQTSSETKNTRGGTSKPQRNICKQASQRQDKKKFTSMGNTPMASSTCAEPHTIGSESDLSSAPLKGWPLIGANHVPPRLGHQVLNSYIQSANNYPRIDMPLSHSQQETYAQLMESTQANALSSFPLTSNLDILLRNRTSGKDDWDDEEKGIEDTIQMLFSQYDDHSNYTNVSYPLQQPSSSSHEQNGHTDISLVQVGTLHASKGKLFSCSFSPNGKLLACAGNDKKVLLWNVDTSRYTSSLETLAHLITDVRFHPSSEFFATSSYDKTVQIWDTADPSKSLFALSGHNDHVMSLDFHPRKMDLLCSSDCNDEIRFWDMKDYNCLRVFKGAIKQVRFQPQLGRLLATASGNGVNIFNVETGDFEFDLKGHQSEVRSICWDVTGNYIASVSEESVRLWSILSGGRCIYELQSKGHNFQSCTFHPGHPVLLIIGSYQFLGSWNPTQSSTVNTILAHSGIIASLASSPSTGLIASASHDQSVKLWI
ncbi:transcriptional corepressor LEUNIG-like isoform X2 [Amaranthus tricolor]|uniref:transcriptional corepressor LEUNIG-like isoform X2 n=1 Tax=Amaranthus tricolor TaxID=29722 RepID=UPI0025892ED2|nr:transcriptional corepressor LEUNIG-like isoform X2 [Amaranthus tricolor]